MKKKSCLFIFIRIVGMGVLMGALFPIYVSWFIEIPEETKFFFGLSCLLAGIIVGIINYFVTFSIFKSLKEEEKKAKILEKTSLTDPLTGLLNRHAFNVTVSETQTTDCQKPLTVAFIDIDNFGRINNTYGHLMGDKILKQIACIITNSIRAEDKAYRYGGEEIVIFFDNTKLDIGEIICQRLKDNIEKFDFGTNENVTVSIGLSFFDNANNCLEKAIEQADNAMYWAKAQGKNKLQIYCENYQVI